MVTLFQLIIAFVLFLLSFVGLGVAVLAVLQIKLRVAERLVIAAYLGVSIGISVMVAAALLVGPGAYWLTLLFGGFGIWKFRILFADIRSCVVGLRQNSMQAVLGVVATVSLASTVLLGGMQQNGTIVFQEIHDSLWHVSLIKSLLQSFPPQHPAFPSITLEQYHYFYDVFLAGLHVVSGAPILTLFFQFSPVLLSGLLMSSAWLLGSRLAGKAGGALLVFLTAFTGSFAYLIPLFLPGQIWGESSFWVSQTFIMMVNPQIILTLGLVYVFFLLIRVLEKPSWQQHVLFIALIAPSIGFKSYSWVILSVVYAGLLAWQLLVGKQLKSIVYGIAYLLVAAPFIWLITRFKSGSFFYEPMWYLNTMVESPDRLNYIPWKLMEDHYRLKKNWPRVLEIKLKELLIFYFGNLGVRSLFVATPLLLIRKQIARKHALVIVLAILGFLFSSIFPLLFLQAGVVWNSIQFWYYALIFANILAMFCLVWVFSKVGSWEKYVLLVLVISLSVPTYVKAVSQKFTNLSGISVEQAELLGNLDSSDTILLCPEDTPLFKSTLITAFTPAAVYLSDPVQLQLVETDLSAVTQLETIFRKKDQPQLKELLKDENVSEVLCANHDLSEFITETLELEPTQYGDWNSYSLTN